VSPLKLKKEWLYKDALDNPILVLKQAAIRSLTLNLFVVNSKPPEAFRLSVIPGKVIYLLFHVAVNSVYLLILLASAYFLFSQRRRIASYWTLWSTYVALLIFAALTYSEPRYLVPSLPGLAVMAGISLAPIVRKLAVFPRVKAVLESRLSPA
jgi:hypothetical protein